MRYYKILLLFFISIISLPSFAQNAIAISGNVTEGTSFISGASVLLKGTKTGALTDTSGHYEITGVKPGTYTLLVSYLGYITKSKQITVKENQQLMLSFDLVKDPHELGNVDVVGKTKVQVLKESSFTVNSIDTRKLANTTADLNQILNRSTGIKIREQGGLGSDFNFSLNGLSGKQVRFFMDGIPMENFGKSMSLNNIPVNLAERIDVYKGVVPVELGADALGGAVNIITDQHTKKFLDASYSYGSFNTSRAALNGRFTEDKTGLIFNLSGFHNYSDNDYLMRNNPKYDSPIKVIENGQVVEKDARRFHDAYRSTMGQMDIGLTNKSWADQISLGMVYSSLYKEIQTGASQNKVFGGVNNRENFIMTNLKYKKKDFLLKGLSMNTTASYSVNNSKVIDTANNIYGWGGKGREELIAGELNGVKSINHFKNKAANIRTNFNYAIDEHQSINLNYNFSHFGRTNRVEVGRNVDNGLDVPNTIDKNIVGLAYQNNMLNDRLSVSAFTKYYGLNTFVRDAIYLGDDKNWTKIDTRSSNGYFGYGAATRFKFTENAGVKVSYEHAYRLQDPEELFGNGIDISANSKLLPEQSDNINAGLYYGRTINDHHFSVEASYIFRNAKQFIYFIPGGIYSQYQNVGKAKINGVDAEVRYSYKQLIEATVNATYQNAKNNQRYIAGTTIPDATYGDQIPNQPWLFGNANIGIGKNDWFQKGSRVQFNWSTQYVHWFYLNWESRGSKESNDKIPGQLVHNASLSYSFENGKYNISAECLNVTNELAYDNFRLQKPGRSAFLKLRYFIR